MHLKVEIPSIHFVAYGIQEFKMKAFIFDLDGVLVDTAKYHYLAWLKISEKYGFHFNEIINEKLKGVSRTKCLEIIINNSNIKINENEKDIILKEKNDVYLNYIETLTPNEILPGVIDILDYAKKNNIYVCLGSASKNARPILTKVGINEYFDCIVDGSDVTKAKPDPEVFLIGANMLNTPPDKCVVFEDSDAGIEAAHKAQMKTVGVGLKNHELAVNLKCSNLTEITPEQIAALF